MNIKSKQSNTTLKIYKKMKTLILLILFTPMIYAQQIVDVSDTELKIAKNVEIIYQDNQIFSGVVTEQYVNGKPKLFKTVKNVLADGPWQEWYQNGNLKFDANWKEGKGHGLWKYFHENGQVRQEEFYNMDKPIGIFRSYYINGQLKTITYWLDGKKQAYEEKYTETGILIENQNL